MHSGAAGCGSSGDETVSLAGGAGSYYITVLYYGNADDPNEVVVLFKWDTLENARWFAKSGALPEAMQLPGDSGPTEIYFLDEVD